MKVTTRRLLMGGVLLLGAWQGVARADTSQCFADSAATQTYTLGIARNAAITPDGRGVMFLRSGAQDTALQLWYHDIATGQDTALTHVASANEHLSVEEKARRERARLTMTGVTAFEMADAGTTAIASQAGHLLRISLSDHAATALPGDDWGAPSLSPDGRHVAAVKGNDIHIITLATGKAHRLTHGGTADLTHGVAEFAAAEELDRHEGMWWSPDSRFLVYEEADLSGVEKHYIADPENPSTPPVAFRYPKAGTPNARVRLGIIRRSGGGTRWIRWDSTRYPYVVRVVWSKETGRLSLVVMDRAQDEEHVLDVNPHTGRTKELLSEHDAAWVNIAPTARTTGLALPYWMKDGQHFLWASERSGQWQLEMRHADGTLDHVVTPPTLPFASLDDVDFAGNTITFTATPDRMGTAVYRADLRTGAVTPLATAAGLHQVNFTPGRHDQFIDRFNAADGSLRVLLRGRDGQVTGSLPDVARALPPFNMQFLTIGAQGYDAMVVRPVNFHRGQRLPVILSVYAGPGYKEVLRAPRMHAENQCLANQGFIVVSLDGRGTPGRSRDWERAIHDDLIDAPLEDQVAGVTALGKAFPEMDMKRVGVYGWSFGGYFTAMAVMRHPELFRAGVAGAPPVDFSDYDTAYTERYLGLPDQDVSGYRTSNVLTYASGLSRPLLLIHGVTDDNVYFINTLKLTRALVTAGRPYDLMLLPGTHMLSDPTLRSHVAIARMQYLKDHLSSGR
ncbi:S9 family peptidase [Gluconacetobacter entanii]|uniref:S9 family peptidase n=1 Tax=Gluconacetobacter entanii TaxID=108528 RepID=A0ABT3K5A4_9PROT|nr:DPP IV N-terminal domain-containing protein [Gluconacetobacter entanii]MCW4590257.1 S9 family peptidase [Gluconacetobacter entanii]MCW4593864.1 S9 family peptidase [Gluconacetobacter entanii]NPC88662.1 prolyl oligopeptidase family serine peptidase [Gluconacetobacter entanii]